MPSTPGADDAATIMGARIIECHNGLNGCKFVKSNKKDQFIQAGSPLAMCISADKGAFTRIELTENAKLELVSACLDTSFAGNFGQARLLIRIIRNEGDTGMDLPPWCCVCNYLGSERGGGSLPATTTLGLKATGPCVIELAADYSDSNSDRPLEGGINVFGNVETVSGTGNHFINKLLWPTSACGKISKVSNNEIAPMKQSQTVPWRGSLGRLTKLTHVWSFMALYSAIFFQYGGGYESNGVGTTSQRRNMRESSKGIFSEERVTSSAGPISSPTSWPTYFPTSPGRISPTSSSLPTLSTPPTFSGGCMNLSLAILMPPPTFTHFNVSLMINMARNGEEVKWEMDYELGWEDYRINSILVEHANGTNSKNEAICLPEGDYTFDMGMIVVERCENDCMYSSNPYWEDGYGVNNIWFILSSDGKRISCGDLIKGPAKFSLPFELKEDHSDPCVLGSDEPTSVNDLLKTLQCYYSAFNYDFADIYDKKQMNDEAWFNKECGPMLASACENGDMKGTDIPGMEDFCTYHQCAYAPFQEGRMGDYYQTCGCLYHNWDCNYGSSGCDFGDTTRAEALRCCNSNGNSCECLIGPVCQYGNQEECANFANNCCTNDECSCKYQRKSCIRSLREKVEIMADSSLYDLMSDDILSECTDAEKACCGDVEEISGETLFGIFRVDIKQSTCGCEFWEQLCDDQTGLVCDLAAGRCCGSTLHAEHNPHCYCEFYNHAENFGYQLEDYTCLNNMNPRHDERNILINVYNELGGTGWINKTGWLGESIHCDWFGVACNEEGLVIGIDLAKNNLTGAVVPRNPWDSTYDNQIRFLVELRVLNLRDNNLSGGIGTLNLYQLLNLAHIDLSKNHFYGEAMLLSSPSVEFLNFSHNDFTSISRSQKFKSSYHTLRTCDLSYNKIQGVVSEILKDTLLPNIKELLLTGNSIQGTLPESLQINESLRRFLINNNMLSGHIPDIPRYFPRLRDLNLSNQSLAKSAGLSGTIPGGWLNTPDLDYLNLSYNQLTGAIPRDMSNVPHLKVLDISNNKLNKDFIPAEIGKLGSTLEVFDVSNNTLEGLIPSQLGMLKLEGALVSLSGNSDISNPAPLSLCDDVDGFDLKNDLALCPPERSALKEIYRSAKGQEWTESANWTDEYIGHCYWYGVTCRHGITTGLNLTHNGLSGTLSKRIAELHSLEVLDVNDNALKGTIPIEIGLLSNLTHLRLSYNALINTVPSELGRLQHLELGHLHGNMLSGEMPVLNTQGLRERSSFISDCGVPTIFDEPLSCPECTICCNADEECESAEPTRLEQVGRKGFNSYREFVVLFLLLVLGYVVVVAISSSLYDKHWLHSLPRSETERSILIKDKQYALETIGSDSVYSFFLSKSTIAWSFALVVMIIQVLALLIFVWSSVKDFSDEGSDNIYMWRCPRNSLECIDEDDLDWKGWTIFGILMVAHLLKDIINGLKLLILSGKQRHSLVSKSKFFFGGLFLTLVSSMTLYTSTVYNIAIARSNTDVIVNSVIILFIVDMDEQFHTVLMAANSLWVGGLVQYQLPDASNEEKEDDLESRPAKLAGLETGLANRAEQLDTCMEDLNKMRQSHERLESRMKNLEKLLASQDPGIVRGPDFVSGSAPVSICTGIF